MLKALALEGFWPLAFSKAKKQPRQLAAKKQAGSTQFWFAVVLISANAILLMSYIYGINNSASKGFQIKSLQTRVSVLNEENNKINLKVSEANSMVSIQSGFLSANFVPAGTSKFLLVNTNQFTQK